MCTIIDETFVIQYQEIQHELWYDDPYFSRTPFLKLQQARLKEETIKMKQRQGIRFRIVKRTTYEEEV